MICKTRGIVLHHFKYTDNSVIASIYTDQFGRQSYLVNGIRNKSSKVRISMLQPLSLLEMDVYHNPKRELQHIKEARLEADLHNIQSDIVKSSIALFLAEVLYKTLHEHEADHDLFGFLWHSIKMLEIETEGLANFHLMFLIRYSKHLGFFPGNNYSAGSPFFDMRNGLFSPAIPDNIHYFNADESRILNNLLNLQFGNLQAVKMNHLTRTNLLSKILEYFMIHLGKASDFKSLEVLMKVFEE